MKNTEWIPIASMGNFFRLFNGELQACPMNADDSRDSDESICEVDWHGIDEDDRIKCAMIQEVLSALRD